MRLRCAVVDGYQLIFRFSLAPPGAGTYTFTGSSGNQTISLGTYWANPADHTQFLLAPRFDWFKGFIYANVSQPVYVSAYTQGGGSPLIQGSLPADLVVKTLDHTGATINTFAGMNFGFPMIQDFQGLTLPDDADGLGDCQGILIDALTTPANAIDLSLVYTAGSIDVSNSVTIVVPPIMYYMGGPGPLG